MTTSATSSTSGSKASTRIDALERALAKERAALVAMTRQRDLLQQAHERLRMELALLKRRLYVAKAERVDTAQLEIEFAAKVAELDQLVAAAEAADAAGENDGADVVTSDAPPATGGAEAASSDDTTGPPPERKKRKSGGPRDWSQLQLEEERIEIDDPLFEALVASGDAVRIAFEESSKIMKQRGGYRRVVVARVKYRAVNTRGESEIETAEMPAQILERSIATPSLLAHIITDKYCDGLPLHRIEDRAKRLGVPLDRGTMCRWAEEVGGIVGTTVVAAMKADAIANSFCIATDATGASLQPVCEHGVLPQACKPCRTSTTKKPRRACQRGHFFVLVADRDHILYEFTLKETSAFVHQMLAGFCGYVQADAKSVFDILFGDPKSTDDEDLYEPKRIRPLEVACWAHTRRKFWEATVTKDVVAREGLMRIGRIYDVDDELRGKPPREIHRGRAVRMAPQMHAFFEWAEAQFALVKNQRGLLRSALGYALRQRAALCRVLDNGRLHLDNNRSERALRPIAVGRKAWLFFGTDDHAESAGHLFSLIASARLHNLDPEAYLRDLFRVLPHWPKGRFLELCPRDWARTRARLDASELAHEVGRLTVPALAAPEEQTLAS